MNGKYKFGPSVERYITIKNLPKLMIRAKLCKDILPLFDLTNDQILNILEDGREDFLITSSLTEIYENPFCLCEEYLGFDADDKIGFLRIDHGMMPSKELTTNFERIRFDDPRRLRALMVDQLNVASSEGHTFIDRNDLFSALKSWHAENDQTGNFIIDEAIWEQCKEIFSKKIKLDQADGVQAIFLNKIYSAERIIRKETLKLMNEDLLATSNINWKKILTEFQSEDKEHKPILRAIDEQSFALEKLYRSRFSVLTGSAGTGKTSVLRSLIHGIKSKDPNQNFLLLAPTGKASIILGNKVQNEAKTIHSFLMGKKWLNNKNFTLKETGGKRLQDPGTIIIDEASMIEVNLLATLFRSIDLDNAERLILVGDVSQLPPIGPGKPFADIIEYLKSHDNLKLNCLSELSINCRQVHNSNSSLLASHFARINEKPDEEIIWKIEDGTVTGDISVSFWQNDEELPVLIEKMMKSAISELYGSEFNGNLGKGYNTVHGFDNIYSNDDKILDAIQVLTPYRHTFSGASYINQIIQKLLRTEETINRLNIDGYVFFDKVMQNQNFNYHAWDHNNNNSVKNQETYIPNGTLGYVAPNKKGNFQIKFPNNYVRYSYYLNKTQRNYNIELGYATTVHKAQGSQFKSTIIILPESSSEFLSRELLYTALSRSTKKLFLLLQKDMSLLKERRWAGYSELFRRNSSLFKTAKGIPKNGFKKFHPTELINEALPDLLVRSEGEGKIAQVLNEYRKEFYYEKPLIALDKKSWRIPDFTFKHNRKEYYWEHLGMLGNEDYDKKLERKRKWYKDNGFQDQLIETPLEGMSLDESIKFILEDRLGFTKPET